MGLGIETQSSRNYTGVRITYPYPLCKFYQSAKPPTDLSIESKWINLMKQCKDYAVTRFLDSPQSGLNLSNQWLRLHTTLRGTVVRFLLTCYDMSIRLKLCTDTLGGIMHMSKEQLTALIEVAGQSPKNGMRDRLMILVAACHGLRASEVTRLTTASIVDGHLKVVRLKGSNITVQPILPCEIELEAYAAQLPDGARLFPVCRQTFHDIIQKHGKTAGIPSHLCHPHALKATCAKLALRNGVGIDDLQTYIGWKSLASATAYLRSDETEASAAFGQVWTSLLPA